MTYVGKQGSLTLSESTNHHQFSFLFPLQMSPWQILATLILPRFTLSSPNPLPQEMLEEGGMWVQINLETNCKLSIAEYPVGESYFCSRVWEGREECQLPEPPAPGERDTQRWGLAQRDGAMHSEQGSCSVSGLSRLLLGYISFLLPAEEVPQGLLMTVVLLPPF